MPVLNQAWRIKCNVRYMVYLYWSGVEWTPKLERARVMDSESEARRELRDLSPPREYDKKGPGPEIFNF